ncbi:MAG: hypothetical protein OQL19_04865 [Gammaproteobacteria bacterium]|nr:hypothetical protein [Gammaproteobacteria bacterium]
MPNLIDVKSTKKEDKNYCIDFHGATFINRVGQEVAITEEMVEEACQQYLDDSAMTPYLLHSA